MGGKLTAFLVWFHLEIPFWVCVSSPGEEREEGQGRTLWLCWFSCDSYDGFITVEGMQNARSSQIYL